MASEYRWQTAATPKLTGVALRLTRVSLSEGGPATPELTRVSLSEGGPTITPTCRVVEETGTDQAQPTSNVSTAVCVSSGKSQRSRSPTPTSAYVRWPGCTRRKRAETTPVRPEQSSTSRPAIVDTRPSCS